MLGSRRKPASPSCSVFVGQRSRLWLPVLSSIFRGGPPRPRRSHLLWERSSGRVMLGERRIFSETALYSSIRIQGYRGLDSFRMEGLGRVNLLVGPNNSGKTSILECIELLRSAGKPHVLWSIAGRRGEFVNEEHAQPPPGPRRDILDISHLFANRELRRAIQIEAAFDTSNYPAGWNDKVKTRRAPRTMNRMLTATARVSSCGSGGRRGTMTTRLPSRRTDSCSDRCGTCASEMVPARECISSGPAG